MRARHRAKTLRRHVKGNDRGSAAVMRNHAAGFGSADKRLVERCHALRQVIAKAADMADRKCFRSSVHGEISVADAVDLAHRHNRPSPGAIERDGQFCLAPEQGQQCHDQAGTMRRKHRQHEFDSVGQLDCDNGVGRQACFDEMRC